MVGAMATTASPDIRMTSAEFLALVDQGVLGPEDKVELLEGVLVTMAPSGPLHASIVTRTQYALYDRLRGRAAVRSQVCFVATALSVAEPDVTVARATSRSTRTPIPSTRCCWSRSR